MLCIHKFRWPNIKRQSYDQAVTGHDEEIQVPVLIVGGSLVGLSTALLLARYGISEAELHAKAACSRCQAASASLASSVLRAIRRSISSVKAP